MSTAESRGLLIDWGGVLTTNLFASFRAFCADEGLDPERLANAFRRDTSARENLIALEEGRLTEDEFEPRLAAILEVEPEGLVDRMFAGSRAEPEMIDAVRSARAAGVRTGLVSNSWGTRRYPRDVLAELFDGVVISGEVGMRKPAPEIYSMGAERIGLEPRACVFVDDLEFNLEPARELGMSVVHHITPGETIAELERVLGVPLTP